MRYAFPSRSMANITHNTRLATPTIARFFEPVFFFSLSNMLLQRRYLSTSRQWQSYWPSAEPTLN